MTEEQFASEKKKKINIVKELLKSGQLTEDEWYDVAEDLLLHWAEYNSTTLEAHLGPNFIGSSF